MIVSVCWRFFTSTERWTFTVNICRQFVDSMYEMYPCPHLHSPWRRAENDDRACFKGLPWGEDGLACHPLGTWQHWCLSGSCQRWDGVGGEATPQEGEKGSSGVHRSDVEGRRIRTIIFVKHFRPHTKLHTVCRCRVIKRASVKFSFSLLFDLFLTWSWMHHDADATAKRCMCT